MNLETLENYGKSLFKFYNEHKSDILRIGGTVLASIGAVLLAKNAVKMDRKAEHHEHVIKLGGRVSVISEYVRSFAPPIVIFGAGMLALNKATLVEKENCGKALAAFTGINAILTRYRAKIGSEIGYANEKEYFSTVKKEYENENSSICGAYDHGHNDFSRFFGIDYSWVATGMPEKDISNLIDIEKDLTAIMRRERRDITVNEAYEALGLYANTYDEKVYQHPFGDYFGWKWSQNGLNVVDLGLFETPNDRYIQGLDDVMLIDPQIVCLTH